MCDVLSDRSSPGGCYDSTSSGTALLSYLVGAAEDTLVAAEGCAKSEGASVGVFYPVPAYDRIAQEMAQCGLDSTVWRSS